MKKKIFGGIAVVAIAVAVALNVNIMNKKSTRASSIALANMEQLANGEEFTIVCNRTGTVIKSQCWSTEWTYLNWDCCCYWTGLMSSHCSAGKEC